MKTRYFYVTETAEDWTYRVEQVTASAEGKRRINRIEGHPEHGVVELGAFDRQVRVELQNGDVDIYMSHEYDVPDRYQVRGEASYDASSPTGSVRIVSQESYRGPVDKLPARLFNRGQVDHAITLTVVTTYPAGAVRSVTGPMTWAKDVPERYQILDGSLHGVAVERVDR